MVRKIFGGSGHSVCFDIGRGGRENDGKLGYSMPDQRAVRRLLIRDRYIETLFNQIDFSVCNRHIEADTGIFLQPAGEFV